MMAGDLGINLSVISDYHGAKDPDELIQRSPELWQEAVTNFRPAVDYLLDKYEENLDLSSGAGKREYSDVAMKLLKYVVDPVERKHYEQLVARRLDCTVEDLHAKKIQEKPRRLKKVENVVEADFLKGVIDNLQAILIYGGVTGVKGVELPEEETKLAELEMVYETRYKGWTSEMLEKEAKELLARYKAESRKREVDELTERLAQIEQMSDEERTEELDREYEEILKKIMAIKRA